MIRVDFEVLLIVVLKYKCGIDYYFSLLDLTSFITSGIFQFYKVKDCFPLISLYNK